MPLGVNHLARTVADSADGRDFSVADTDVSLKARQSRTVNKRTVFDKQIVLHFPSISEAEARKQGMENRPDLT